MKKSTPKGFKVLYRLIGLSPFDIPATDALSQIARDNSISCGEGLVVQRGEIVTPCPIVAQNYNEASDENSVKTTKIPIW